MKRAVTAVVLAASAFGSSAGVLAGNDDSCTHLAQTVTPQVMEVRDAGVSWEEFSVHLNEMLARARSNPDSYVRDSYDEDLIRRSFQALWGMPKLSVFQAAMLVYQACMRKAPELYERG